MPCYHPLHVFQQVALSPSGKRPLSFDKSKMFDSRYQPVTIACGQCFGCRLERSRQWAVRCMHEAQYHDKNCFVTLTYNDDFYPETGLQLEHFQKFMKRLRKKFAPQKIRFFHAGEYGDVTKRAHYHVLLFGIDFEDKLYLKTVRGNKYYTSEILAKLWKFGFHTIGEVTFESAAYVARYCMKKLTGDAAIEYIDFDKDTGEVNFERRPPYITMSRRSAIGKEWFNDYYKDVYKGDDSAVVLSGKQQLPPRFYDKQYEIINPEHFELIKKRRIERAKENQQHTTPERLAVREERRKKITVNLTRDYENGNETL